MFGPTYSPIKLKLNLDLSIKRLKLLQQKHDNAGSLTRKEVAKYLEREKIDLAEIKTEQIVRDDYYREALEILEMFCNLLLTRFGLLDSKKECDEGLREAVYTIIWCAPRISADLREFNEIKKQLTYRFGKELVEAASSSENQYVSKRVVHKLSVAAPPRHMVMGYLRVIADTYKVKWLDKWGETPSLIDTNVPDTLQGSDFGDGKAGGAGGGGGYGGFGGKAAVDSDLAGLAFPPAMGSSAYAPPAAAAAGGASAAYPPQQQQPEMYPPQQPPPPPQQQQQQPELYPPQRTHTGPPPSYSDPNPAAALDPFPSVPAASGADQHPASSIIPDLPAVPTGAPGRGSNGGGSGGFGGGSSVPPGSDSVPDFDDLARRLNALKSRS